MMLSAEKLGISAVLILYLFSELAQGISGRKNQYKPIPQIDPSSNDKKTNNGNDNKDKR